MFWWVHSASNVSIITKHIPETASVEIIVRDNGPGLPEMVKSRLFEPYISTKGEGHTGLGLSIVYNIIQKLNGTITCTTEKDRGTNFRIVLPLSTKEK